MNNDCLIEIKNDLENCNIESDELINILKIGKLIVTKDRDTCSVLNKDSFLIVEFNLKENLKYPILIIKNYLEAEDLINNLKDDLLVQKNKFEKRIESFLKVIFNKKTDEIIEEKIKKIVLDGDYENADNFRYAEIGNDLQELIYKEKKRDGCCGYYDEVITVEGIDYIVGFNYGH